MSEKGFSFVPTENIRYYGSSDLLAQIADELRNCPDSCFSQNVLAWYNAEYSALSSVDACEYQVAINEQLCPEVEPEPPETLEDVIDIIGEFIAGDNRRIARVAIGIICREARRQLTEGTASDV